MATAIHTSTLSTLPLELRELIYSELLSSTRSSPLVLYNEDKGWEEHFNLHPSILRTNKQIHAEAISYLYKDKIFDLDLDGLFSRGCHPPTFGQRRPILPLLRNDDTLRTAVLVDGEYHDCQHKPIHRDCRCRLLPLPGPGAYIFRVNLSSLEAYLGHMLGFNVTVWGLSSPSSVPNIGPQYQSTQANAWPLPPHLFH